MDDDKQNARTTGLCYFAFLVFGGFAQIVRNMLIIPGNDAATLQNLAASDFLFRMSIASDLIGSTIYLFLALALYRLLRFVGRNAALVLLTLVITGLPIAMLTQLCQFAPALLLSHADSLNGLSEREVRSLALFFLELAQHGIFIADIFWGLWLIPFGYLAFKSGFMPRALGILLMAGSSGFLTEFVVLFLFPRFQVVAYPGLAVATIAELSTIVWLLAYGLEPLKTSQSQVKPGD